MGKKFPCPNNYVKNFCIEKIVQVGKVHSIRNLMSEKIFRGGKIVSKIWCQRKFSKSQFKYNETGMYSSKVLLLTLELQIGSLVLAYRISSQSRKITSSAVLCSRPSLLQSPVNVRFLAGRVCAHLVGGLYDSP